eukprot:8933642-Alexandrium_andersonii.AAC.1
MSASLVGSEMCIRDSLCSLAAALAAVASLVPCLSAGPLGRAPGLPAPVSYTHLTLPTICSV